MGPIHGLRNASREYLPLSDKWGMDGDGNECRSIYYCLEVSASIIIASKRWLIRNSRHRRHPRKPIVLSFVVELRSWEEGAGICARDWTGGQIERFSYCLLSFPASLALAGNAIIFY
jgi:hypothetical protein